MAAYPTFPTDSIKAKNVHLILSKLLAPAEVCLGRLVSNIWDPSGNFHDPDFQTLAIPDHTSSQEVKDIQSISNKTHTRDITGILSSLLSASRASKRGDTTNLQASNLKHFKLMNPDTFFTTAINQGTTQTWIGGEYLKGHTVFMIIGYSIVQGLRVSAASEIQKTQAALAEGTAPCSAALVNLGLALSGPLQSTVEHQKTTRTQTGAFYPGDNVWAVLYRKVKLRDSIATSSLSKTCGGWTVLMKPRAQPQFKILIEPELEAAGVGINEEECGVVGAMKEDEIGWESFGGEGDDVFLLPDFDDEE